MAVFLERRATTGGIDDDRVQLEVLEGGDVTSSQRAGGVTVAGVHMERSAAALLGWREHLATVAGQDADGGQVGFGLELAHDAAGDETDSVAALADGGRRFWRAGLCQAALGWPNQRLQLAEVTHGAHQPARFEQGLQPGLLIEPKPETKQVEGPISGEHLPQNEAADCALGGAVGGGHPTGALDEGAVLNASGADRLAGAAVEAGVHVLGELRVGAVDR